MKLKLFTDLIDALSKITGGLQAIANLPKAERDDDAPKSERGMIIV